jgi:membrane fusion protein, heavy metal efflux system
MKFRLHSYVARGAMAALFAVLLTGCGAKQVEETQVVAASNPALAVNVDEVTVPTDSPKLTRIHVAPVEIANVPMDEVTAPGKVQTNPNRVSHVVLPLAGRIASVNVKVGDFIQQGQPLLTVESPDVDTAVTALQQAESSVTQAKAALAKAQSDMDRTKDLFEHNAVAQKEVVNAEAVLTQAKAAVEQSQSTVRGAERRLEIYGVKPGQFGQKVTVRAPISGKVLDLSVVQGEYRNDTSAPLMTLADLSTVWVSAGVPETSIRFIELKERIDVEFTAYPGQVFQARVMQIADTVDPNTRTIEVRAELDNHQGKLRPEMFCQIHHIDKTAMMPVVPIGALVQEDGRNVVWVQTAPGKFERRTVEIGDRIGEKQAILKGLKAAEQVVVDGVMLLKQN